MFDFEYDEFDDTIKAICPVKGWSSQWYDEIDHADRMAMDLELTNHESVCEAH